MYVRRFLEDGGDSFLATRLLASIEDELLGGRSRPDLMEPILTSTFEVICQKLEKERQAEKRKVEQGPNGLSRKIKLPRSKEETPHSNMCRGRRSGAKVPRLLRVRRGTNRWGSLCFDWILVPESASVL